MRRLAAVLAGVFAVLILGAAPAHADLGLPDLPDVPGLPSVPGVPSIDCTAEVPIGSPATGPANNIDPGPKDPNTGNPFSDTPDSTIYEVYGYGGLSWPSLQDGCSFGVSDSVAHPGDSAAGTFANIGLGGLSLAVSLIATVMRFAFNPDTLAVLDPVVSLGAEALGNTIFRALFFVPLIATGILIVFRANRARFSEALQGAGWVLMVGIAAVVAMTWPLTLAPLFDKALTGAVGAINSTVANFTGSTNLDAADGTAANLHKALLYQTWCSGMVGKGDGPTAEKFCPQLFATSTFSRTEWEQVQKDPSKSADLVAAKQEAFKAVAEKLKEQDPAAYEYLNGQHNTDRIWYVAVGWIGLACAGGFVAMASLLLLYALIVMRLAIIVFPAVAVVGAFPPLRSKVVGLFDYTMGALVTALIFGSLAAVFVAMIGAFMGPGNVLPPVVSMVLLLLVTIAAWKLSKPYRRVKGLAHIKRRHGLDRHNGATPMTDDDDPSTKAPSGSGGIFAPSANPDAYASATPAEAHRPGIVSSSLRGAAEGAAITAAAGLVTGGTVTAAGMAAGAARGAGGAATASAMAQHAQHATEAPTRPHALPRGSEPPPRVYTPGEGPQVRTVEPTVTDTGERVYPIYTPTDEKAVL